MNSAQQNIMLDATFQNAWMRKVRELEAMASRAPQHAPVIDKMIQEGQARIKAIADAGGDTPEFNAFCRQLADDLQGGK